MDPTSVSILQVVTLSAYNGEEKISTFNAGFINLWSGANKCGIHIISIPKMVHRLKVVSQFERMPSYPDVDERYFFHQSFGKIVFRPKNRDASARDDIITYNQVKHKTTLNLLIIGPTIPPALS